MSWLRFFLTALGYFGTGAPLAAFAATDSALLKGIAAAVSILGGFSLHMLKSPLPGEKADAPLPPA